MSTILRLISGLCLWSAVLWAADAAVPNWPQFRGPGGSGLGADDAAPPSEFGPQKALLWKTSLPLGHGSPSIWGDRIFVTAFDKPAAKLELIALDRGTGKIVWRQAVTPRELEKVHAVSSPATSTPVTDGRHIYVYYGSQGLLAYDWTGKLAWEFPLPVSQVPNGSGASPVLAGDIVLLNRDYMPEPQLLAVSRVTGKLQWKAALPESTTMGPKASHATPLVWKDEVLLHRPGELAAYALQDGARRWWVRISSQGTSTPVISQDAVYLARFDLGEPDGAPPLPLFSAVLEKYDRDTDGKISADEAPQNDLYFFRRPGVPDDVPGAHFTIKMFFSMLDGNKDGGIDKAEWTSLGQMMRDAVKTGPAISAIRLGGEGDRTDSAILWAQQRNVPEVPAPVVYRGRVYSVTNGGILSCLDAASGKVIFRGRLGAPGAYYASPVAAADKIFVASGEGVVTVLAAGDTLQVLANNDLEDPVFGTPALVNSALYVRSAGHLWAFGTN